MLSGITISARYPRAAAIHARPIPVLPLVGSMMVPPGLSAPLSSAASSMAQAVRSLTLPAGLNASSLAAIVAFRPFSRQ